MTYVWPFPLNPILPLRCFYSKQTSSTPRFTGQSTPHPHPCIPSTHLPPRKTPTPFQTPTQNPRNPRKKQKHRRKNKNTAKQHNTPTHTGIIPTGCHCTLPVCFSEPSSHHPLCNPLCSAVCPACSEL